MKKSIFKENVLPIIIIIVSVLLVSGLGGLFVNMGSTWFESLSKPSQYPEDIVFAVVWSVVYVSFIVVLSVWEISRKISVEAIILLIINGALNVLWCLVFFTLNLTFAGLVVIIFNLIAAIILWKIIFEEEKIYAFVLSLYPLWICIATCLNLAVWILN